MIYNINNPYKYKQINLDDEFTMKPVQVASFYDNQDNSLFFDIDFSFENYLYTNELVNECSSEVDRLIVETLYNKKNKKTIDKYAIRYMISNLFPIKVTPQLSLNKKYSPTEQAQKKYNLFLEVLSDIGFNQE